MFCVVVTSPTMPSSSCRYDHWQPQCFSFEQHVPTCRARTHTHTHIHPTEFQPNASPWLCNSFQAKTTPQCGRVITAINTVYSHSSQLNPSTGRNCQKTYPLSDQSQLRTENLKFGDSEIFVFDQRPEHEVFQTTKPLKNWSLKSQQM